MRIIEFQAVFRRMSWNWVASLETMSHRRLIGSRWDATASIHLRPSALRAILHHASLDRWITFDVDTPTAYARSSFSFNLESGPSAYTDEKAARSFITDRELITEQQIYPWRFSQLAIRQPSFGAT